MSEQAQQLLDREVRERVHDERDDIRGHELHRAERGVRHQPTEGPQQRQRHDVEELLEAARLPGAEELEADLEADQAVREGNGA
jgi:hypothetical protein